jgi:tetratricopeptide (TPR) repeat protein
MKLLWFMKGLSLGRMLFILFAVLLAPRASAGFKYVHEGMRSPEIEGKDVLTGEEITLSEFYKDGIIAVVFWATWSERSIEELRELSEISARLGDVPFEIIAVNVDAEVITPQLRSEVEAIVKELGITFTVIVDEGLEFFYEFGVIAVPSTAIIDQDGSLRYSPAGYSLLVRDAIEDSVKSLLGLELADTTAILAERYRPEKKATRYYYLASKLARQRMYERAVSHLKMAKEADDSFAAPFSLHGEILLRLDSVEQAREEFKEAIARDSNSAAAWVGLAETFLLAGHLDSAYQALSLAIEMDESYVPALTSIGLCLAEQGSISEALDSLNRAGQLNIRDPRVYYYTGKVHLMASDSTQAVLSFRQALNVLYPLK